MTAIQCVTFDDICGIVLNRGKISGTPQPKDLQFVQGVVNEYYMQIASERNWKWRNYDRAFIFKRPITTGTVNVTNGSRTVVFSAVSNTSELLGKSLNVNGDEGLYRIIGRSASLNQCYLEAPYAGTTNATAQFKLFQYEFALPPDMDSLLQVNADGLWINNGQLDEITNLEFNRFLTNQMNFESAPTKYAQTGDQFIAGSLPPLDVMVLDYDFLGGRDIDKTPRLRLFPIAPDKDRVIHINYSKQVEPMLVATDQPLIPVNDRWVLVHYAMAEWKKINGDAIGGASELKAAEKKLKEMRDKYKTTSAAPKMILDGSRYNREHGIGSAYDLYRLSRQNEY